MNSSIATLPIATLPIGTAPIVTSDSNAQEPSSFPPGTWTFTPPVTGYWKFVMWGAGGQYATTNGGASGAYCEITRFLTPAQAIPLVVSALFSVAPATTATFPDGTVASAGSANGVTAGAATGGDVNINGTAGSASAGSGSAGAGSGGGAGGSSGSAGAPANLPYRGGQGGNTLSGGIGVAPGGGTNNGISQNAGGLVLVVLVR